MTVDKAQACAGHDGVQWSFLKAGYLGRRLIPAGHSKRTLAVLRRREARKHLAWFDAR